MIYLTGDCHGAYERFSKRQRLRQPFVMTENDFVIICGDMGLVWADDREFVYNKKWLSALPFTILWVQGNHENYDMIAQYPIEMWHGGKTRHIVKDKIILLERGQIFEIEGKRFFTFGGASTHDIQGGILDRSLPSYEKDRRRANRNGLSYRVKGVSWWAQELPSVEEMQEGRDNLEKINYCVDFVITHCLSGKMQDKLQRVLSSHGMNKLADKISARQKDILNDYFDALEERLQYRQWFCGHYHVNCKIDERHTVLYEDIIWNI